MPSPLFCDHCHSLYPAEGGDHFTLLGIERKFNLDQNELRQRYLQISRAVHPDYHGTGERAAASVILSARLNEAYRVLADPALRAEYLLELAGGPSAAADKHVPPDVLAATFALREQIADAKASQSEAVLADCRERVRQMHSAAMQQVADLARRLPGDAELRQQLRGALNTVRYAQKLQSEL